MGTIKPIFLLADSQLLFWREDDDLFLRRVRQLLEADGEGAGKRPKAAYLGASNGDASEFYELFLGAMDQIGIRTCRHIPARPEPEDLEFLDAADVILLAGGAVERGWDAFKAAELDKKLVERYYAGALLLGISAGAVQLGLKGWNATGSKIADMLRIVPFVVDVHDEPTWGRLLQAVPRAGDHARGIGIPSGGGALYHPDYSVEPIRHPLTEVSQSEEGMQQALLLPGESSAPAEPPANGAGPTAQPAAAAAAGAHPEAPAAGAPPGASHTGADPDPDPEPDPDTVERERRELGYSIGSDGIIEIHRPDPDDSVN